MDGKSRKHLRSVRRAFSLVECIAAIVVLSVGIPPLLWAIRQAHVQRVNPIMASKAQWLAAEKLEDIIADRHSATRGWSYISSGNYASEASISGFPGFSRSVTITQTAADLSTVGTGYKKVVVTVNWTDAAQTVRSFALTTVLTDFAS